MLGNLNFVQVDSINTMARAHDLILRSRQQCYRPVDLRKMVDHERSAFEGWTHDASILPIEAFPHWQNKFTRDAVLLQQRWKTWHRGDFLAQAQTILDQIARQGPLGSRDVGKQEKRSSGGWWDWHPSKTALAYLWRTGHIAVTRRNGFSKV
ncbi:MAG: crosslink repair DNA glycosylase YcaQ family protein [Planktomarina sp.]|nr:crosslink repair DNA glycosylase YcaQ family protein [Planktomarina sp.]